MESNQLTIFEKIIKRDIPADIVYENDYLIVMKDINPVAPIHLLIIPKEPFININAISIDKIDIIKEMFLAAQHISAVLPNANEYKLLINNGKSAGQCVFHLHMHFLSGFSSIIK